MLVVLHVLAAFASIIAASTAYVAPSVARLRLTYGLTIAMLATGVYLVVQNTAHLLEACIMGLVFLAVISFETVSARNKLSHAKAKADNLYLK